MMAGVRGINVYGQDIIWVDYEGCKTPEQMIQIFDEALDFLMKKNEQSLMLTSFKNTSIPSPFLHHVQEQTPRVAHLIKRNACIGMSNTKKLILNGISKSSGFNHIAFDSEHEAIKFLLKD
jgi:acyl CoA:acetate/3-ketoacid CoA transferase alpha subunit